MPEDSTGVFVNVIVVSGFVVVLMSAGELVVFIDVNKLLPDLGVLGVIIVDKSRKYYDIGSLSF
jgi:hypothetical protein